MHELPRIYRPNAITPEDWAKLSREQQIQWWKDREPRNLPAPDPARGVELYNTGIITKAELPCFVFEPLEKKMSKDLWTLARPISFSTCVIMSAGFPLTITTKVGDNLSGFGAFCTRRG